MECRYMIYKNGKEVTQFMSYTELLKYIDDQKIKLDKQSDIVYSKDMTPQQEQQCDAIDKIKADYKPVLRIDDIDINSFIDDDFFLEGAALSTIQFINSKAFVDENGRPYLLQFNEQRYRQVMMQHLQTTLKMTTEKAIEFIDTEISHWKRIQIDSYWLHTLFGSYDTINSDKSTNDVAENFLKQDIPQSIRNKQVIENAVKSARQQVLDTAKGLNLRKNVNMKVNIHGKDVYGHIDYLTIAEDGSVNVYLYKVSYNSSLYWPDVKKQKYKYQLAFLKHMLSQNGVNTDHINMFIVPVRVKYDEDFDHITDIVFESEQNYSFNHNGKNIIRKEENIVEKFLPEQSNPLHFDNDELIMQAEHDCQVIFPKVDIRKEGILGSIPMYIQNALDGVDPNFRIITVDTPEYMYEVKINNRTYKIKDKTRPQDNKEIIDIVYKHIDSIDSEKGNSANTLKNAIINLRNGNDESVNGRMRHIIDTQLSKYMRFDMEGNNRVYQWELLQDVTNCNVLIFKNKKTGVYDIVSLSAVNLQVRMSKGVASNLLSLRGYYNSEYIALEGNYGNMEIVRAMTLINQLAKKWGNVTFGNLTIISTANYGQNLSINIGNFNKQYYQDIINMANKKVGQNDKISYNMQNTSFEDPVEHLIATYYTINEKNTVNQKIEKYGFDEIKKDDFGIKDKNEQLSILLNIQYQMAQENPYLLDPENHNRSTNSPVYQLFLEVTKAINYIQGRTPRYIVHVNNIETNFLTATAQSDPNIAIVIDHLQIINNTISQEIWQYSENQVRPVFDKFYAVKGYSKWENITLGDQVRVYKNLYEIDSNTGEMTMNFKNPYDMSNNLTSDERTVLKHFLYQVACLNTHGKFAKEYTSMNDPGLAKYIREHPEYLWVPLERASKATTRKNVKSMLSRMKMKVQRWFSNNNVDEFINNITEEERDSLEIRENNSSNIFTMQLGNKFDPSLGAGINDSVKISEKSKNRAKLIRKYGTDYFEINLENLLIDIHASFITSEQYNKFLVVTKGFILELSLMGSESQGIKAEKKYWEDYLKQNIFHRSIMSEEEGIIVGYLEPLRQTVSRMLIGANIVSAFRDLMEGAQQNFLRSIIKYHTELNASNVVKAYTYVSTHQNGNPMAINLLNKLCLRYRLSNLDVREVTQRAKTGRSGLANYETFIYSTLRTPDFINRMTLFVARCMQDGCWEAFSLDEHGNLKYDWKKDKRFNLYATHNTTDMKKYNEQKSLYYSLIRQYNLEHPNTQLKINDDLPTPYTNKQVVSIRAQADNIYGSYDKSTRAAYEGKSYGIMLGMFTTWMNSIVNNYFMQAQTGILSSTEKIQERDENGNLLYMTDDGQITTDATKGTAIYTDKPFIIQGILPTVQCLISIARHNGKDAMIKYLKANPHERANLKKLLSDLIMWMLFSTIYKMAFTPAYKDYKKEMSTQPLLANIFVEILYKSTSRSYDQYGGPLNILQFVGENMNPPYYSVPHKLANDVGKCLFGDKNWTTILTGNIGFFKSFNDSWRGYLKSQKI